MSAKDKWIRRFSVDETVKHKNGFTIYKITSVLFPLQSPEAVSSVSVWKRYSDVERLHKSMRSLHAGLHLHGTFPTLPRYSYFKRFQQEVIDERAKSIKLLLEFIAEHRLLFTSTEFVNFLQTGYPKPDKKPSGVIDSIRSSLHLPIEEAPPLEYQTDDEDARPPLQPARPLEELPTGVDETDFISQIPIYEAAEVELRPSPINTKANSYESLSSIESIDSDLYDELSKLSIEKSRPSIRRVLPDLINFDVPSTSKFEDYHTRDKTGNTDSEDYHTRVSTGNTNPDCHRVTTGNTDSDYHNRFTSGNTDSEDYHARFSTGNTNIDYHTRFTTGNTDSDTTSLNSNLESSSMCEFESRSSMSLYSKRSALSLSNAESKTRTEDSYVFEAGYMLNLAARCEDMGDFQRAFECYKSGIEKMLIGVQTDPDPDRRALIKEKTNKYLSYAEEIYKTHLSDAERSLLPEQDGNTRALHCPIPISMLKRPYEDLGLYTVLAILGSSMMLVMHRNDKNCYAMKVIQKVPNNLTEFDEYFLQRVAETRTPVLPTVIPYMVPLHAYIETNNLLFLILSYAPGEKLFDYIKNYAKSLPTTPSRVVNLENVFAEPKNKFDSENNINSDNVDSANVDSANVDNRNVDELVLKSQKLLLNVDKVLTESGDNMTDNDNSVCEVPRSVKQVPSIHPRDVLPPSAVCKWGAEILTALESLHNSGVICRDLNPSNILLGERGQIILTYFTSYHGADMSLATLRAKSGGLYVAPELYRAVADCAQGEGGRGVLERVCDFWSYGAVMYELICGVPLSYYHRTMFTSHTILELPEGMPVEVESLLTQLLTYEPSERLGAGEEGIHQIKQHPYFKSVDWQMVYDSWIVPD